MSCRLDIEFMLLLGATQHWIILTDHKSVKSVNGVLKGLVGKHLSMNVINLEHRLGIRRVPRIVIDYIDLDLIAKDDQMSKFISALKFFLPDDMDGNAKYKDDLFFIGPLYHLIFPTIHRLITLDVGKYRQQY